MAAEQSGRRTPVRLLACGQQGAPMSNDTNRHRRTNSGAAGEPVHYEAPGWLSTDDIEQELLLAVVADSRSLCPEERFRRLDDYFAADLEENELQYRRSLLRLLADFRPQLADLLGGRREH
jgi:hypothetical protein